MPQPSTLRGKPALPSQSALSGTTLDSRDMTTLPGSDYQYREAARRPLASATAPKALSSPLKDHSSQAVSNGKERLPVFPWLVHLRTEDCGLTWRWNAQHRTKKMAGNQWAFCRGFSGNLSTYGHQMGLVSHGTFQKSAPKFLPSYPGTVGRKVHRTFQAIFVAFFVPSWLPKLPGIFPGNFENFQAIIN